MSAVFLDPIAHGLDQETNREAWLEWRRGGVGGSDVAAICGLSPFSGATPMRVYLDKRGLIGHSAETEAMRWGSLLEEPITREFERRTGLHVGYAQTLVVDVEHPWRRATLDGLVFEHADAFPPDALGLLEVKTTSDDVWEDGPPDHYRLQVIWSLGILGLERAWLAVLHRGQKLREHELEFEPAVFESLCRIVDRFWHENVLAENPPPPAPEDLDTIKDAWRDKADAEAIVDATEELVDLARQWLAAVERRKVVVAQEDELEARLRLALGEAVALVGVDGPLLTLKSQKTAARLDEKALREAHPELAAQFTKPAGTTRVLRATKALKSLTSTGDDQR